MTATMTNPKQEKIDQTVALIQAHFPSGPESFGAEVLGRMMAEALSCSLAEFAGSGLALDIARFGTPRDNAACQRLAEDYQLAGDGWTWDDLVPVMRQQVEALRYQAAAHGFDR